MISNRDKIIENWIESLFKKDFILWILDNFSDIQRWQIVLEDLKRKGKKLICDKIKINDWQKWFFCKKICEYANVKDFEWFQHIFDILKTDIHN